MASLYIYDSAMMVAAVGSVVSAVPECRREPFKRWRLLLPGSFAIVATILLFAFPDVTDLLQVQLWMVVVVSLLLGVVRGALLGMASDHYWKLVRLDRGIDAMVCAIVVLIVAAVQFAIEATTGAENRSESTFEFLMAVVAGFLLGRSIAVWFRAVALHHHDLHE
ncbi:MAG: hypothetical protein JSR24_09810 [Proteobacteria bacterium]|nr:hypothetical protein [Pseudomonadota bacterium]